MSVQVYNPATYPASSKSRLGSRSMRRLVIVVAGAAVMAVSGGGLAGYLDLSSASAADAPTTSDAAPLN